MTALCWGRGGISVPEELFPVEEKCDQGSERTKTQNPCLPYTLIFFCKNYPPSFLGTDTSEVVWFYYLPLFVLAPFSYHFLTNVHTANVSNPGGFPLFLITQILLQVSLIFNSTHYQLPSYPLWWQNQHLSSVWSWTLSSNLFNSSICFPAKSLSETITTRTCIFV